MYGAGCLPEDELSLEDTAVGWLVQHLSRCCVEDLEFGGCGMGPRVWSLWLRVEMLGSPAQEG